MLSRWLRPGLTLHGGTRLGFRHRGHPEKARAPARHRGGSTGRIHTEGPDRLPESVENCLVEIATVSLRANTRTSFLGAVCVSGPAGAEPQQSPPGGADDRRAIDWAAGRSSSLRSPEISRGPRASRDGHDLLKELLRGDDLTRYNLHGDESPFTPEDPKALEINPILEVPRSAQGGDGRRRVRLSTPCRRRRRTRRNSRL